MDRFIDRTLNLQYFKMQDLKSNMDRFIGKT